MEKIILTTIPMLKSDIDRLQKVTKTSSRKEALRAAVEYYLANHALV